VSFFIRVASSKFQVSIGRPSKYNATTGLNSRNPVGDLKQEKHKPTNNSRCVMKNHEERNK